MPWRAIDWAHPVQPSSVTGILVPDSWFQFEDLTWPPGADPYLYRWTLAVLGGGRRCYLHRYLGSDWSRNLHDHPKTFWSVGLWGGYVEQTSDGIRQWRGPWVRRFPAEHRHRLRVSRRRGCWTLIFTGRVTREWGFWSKGVWIQWQRYIYGQRYIYAGERTPVISP